MYFSIKDPDNNDLYPIAPDGKDGRWRVGKSRLQSLIENDEIHWVKDLKNYSLVFNHKNQKRILQLIILFFRQFY